MVIVKKLVEWRLAGETEVLGENLPQRHFVHQQSRMIRPGFERGPPRWAQAVSRWLSTMEARVRFRVACGVCGGQSGTGACFLRILHVGIMDGTGVESMQSGLYLVAWRIY
jgi:hypothetical protein